MFGRRITGLQQKASQSEAHDSKEKNWRPQMDRLLERARAAFHPCPKIYLADLKEQASRDSVADELLGYPSLAALFRDLRRYVAKHGIDRKLQTVVGGIPVINSYVPQGYSISSEKYVSKLAWFKRLRAYLPQASSARNSDVAVYNITASGFPSRPSGLRVPSHTDMAILVVDADAVVLRIARLPLERADTP